MDYSKMTKEQLVNKLNEHSHLAEAIEAKDKEIYELGEKLREYKAGDDLGKSLKKSFENAQAQISSLRQTIDDLNKRELENLNKIKQLENDKAAMAAQVSKTDALLLENKKALNMLNQYITMTRNTLKMLQGGLDNAIEFEYMLSSTFK